MLLPCYFNHTDVSWYLHIHTLIQVQKLIHSSHGPQNRKELRWITASLHCFHWETTEWIAVKFLVSNAITSGWSP